MTRSEVETRPGHSDSTALDEGNGRRNSTRTVDPFLGSASLLVLLASAFRWMPGLDLAPIRGQMTLLIAIAAVGWLWSRVDALDRQRAASTEMLSGWAWAAPARVALVLLLVLTFQNPGVRAGWEHVFSGSDARPAAADTTIYQAQQICVDGADGRMRLSNREQGCRENELALATELGSGLLGTRGDAGVEYRAGEAMILAGHSHIAVKFSQPMPSADYFVGVSPSSIDSPISSDDACRFASIAGKNSEGFGITMRRCWFEGEDVPTDPILEDLRLDWIAIARR